MPRTSCSASWKAAPHGAQASPALHMHIAAADARGAWLCGQTPDATASPALGDTGARVSSSEPAHRGLLERAVGRETGGQRDADRDADRESIALPVLQGELEAFVFGDGS